MTCGVYQLHTFHTQKVTTMKNDGSEAQELQESNAFEIERASKRKELLKECRDLLEAVFDTQLHEQIQALIKKIDEFYPQAKE